MPFQGNSHEAYWNSYRLLESQLLRLSHSICFDDNQIHVYSSELADIINSACIKIESLAKDIYEEHIWPFQEDNDRIPECFAKGKYKRSADKFDSEKWTRDKYDYHCLVEIDREFSLGKKQIELRLGRFNFRKYGSTIFPFGNISLSDCRGGLWEYSERDIWHKDAHRLKSVDWCKSYQAIKHNYIQSIPEHGTIENAIMVLAAFYLLAVYDACLPYRQFEMEDKADNYAKVIRTLEGQVDTIDAEISRLQSKKKTVKNSIDSIKSNLERSMIQTGKKKIKTDLFSFGIQKNVRVKDESKIPGYFWKQKAPELDRAALKNYLKENGATEYAELVQGESLRIR